MKPERILNIKTRAEWRNWLLHNFNIRNEIWLVYAKKSTGRERIQYNDAVEEALCFGYIDSAILEQGRKWNSSNFINIATLRNFIYLRYIRYKNLYASHFKKTGTQ